jgi:hypothetical protein
MNPTSSTPFCQLKLRGHAITHKCCSEEAMVKRSREVSRQSGSDDAGETREDARPRL